MNKHATDQIDRDKCGEQPTLQLALYRHETVAICSNEMRAISMVQKRLSARQTIKYI